MKEVIELLVIGGGPAGMMAASTAAEHGAKVVLLEKNEELGRKLLITGGGRCNVTNNEVDFRLLASHYSEAQDFLYSAFSQYAVQETLDFFHTHNMETKVEARNRVFPISDSAQSVWNVLVDRLHKYKVQIVSNAHVTTITTDNDLFVVRVKNMITSETSELHAQKVIVATGGKSRPETGSTGDGFVWLKQLGHTIVEPKSILVPIATRTEWVPRLQGVTLEDVKVTVWQDGKRFDPTSTGGGVKKVKGGLRGRVLFTHFGLSGPLILNMSRDIGDLLHYGDVQVQIDLFPDSDHGMLNKKLQELFFEHAKKKIKNVLGEIIMPSVAPIIIDIWGIDPETLGSSITREDRMRLIGVLKALTVEVSHLLDENNAVVTSGGVDLREIDFKTMMSRTVNGLYIVGDMLNVNRPSGGFSLQLCWTTGYLAGISATKQ